MERLVCLLIGYIFGLFQTGYFYGKTQGVDIRKMGSGNAGSTNALRTMGIKAGMITLLGDCFKCVIAVLVVRGIYGQSHADILPLLSLYTGFGAVLGHNFPFYLKFKGGKGIACIIGVSLVAAPVVTLIAFAAGLIFIILFKIGALGAFIIILVPNLYEAAVIGASDPAVCALIFAIVALAFFAHRSNLVRMFTGTENRTVLFGKKKKKNGEDKKV